jgi:hypothetical protein
MKRMVLAALAVVVVAAIGYWAISCPCDRTPGLYLRGAAAQAPVSDWSFANKVPLCQLEVDTGWLPHALNLNCWANSQGELYFGCASCEGKRWSAAAVTNNRARTRLDGTVYDITLTRVTDANELDRIWASRSIKFGEAIGPRPDGWWTFRAVSR